MYSLLKCFQVFSSVLSIYVPWELGFVSVYYPILYSLHCWLIIKKTPPSLLLVMEVRMILHCYPRPRIPRVQSLLPPTLLSLFVQSKTLQYVPLLSILLYLSQGKVIHSNGDLRGMEVVRCLTFLLLLLLPLLPVDDWWAGTLIEASFVTWLEKADKMCVDKSKKKEVSPFSLA